ncbi:MAG: hypothetical protein ABFD79_10635 [Phycisphaerales bacterium]
MEKKDNYTLEEIEPSQNCLDFIENSEGVFLSAEKNFRKENEVLKQDTFKFAKWMRQNKPEIKVEIEKCNNIINLRSHEVWIPLIFLGTNVALPLFLNAVYDYLKFVFRGNLSEDSSRVHLKVIYKDKEKYKELDYNGSLEGFEKIKKSTIDSIVK